VKDRPRTVKDAAYAQILDEFDDLFVRSEASARQVQQAVEGAHAAAIELQRQADRVQDLIAGMDRATAAKLEVLRSSFLDTAKREAAAVGATVVTEVIRAVRKASPAHSTPASVPWLYILGLCAAVGIASSLATFLLLP